MLSMSSTNLTEIEICVIKLHKIGAIKFGDFILKSGIKSPIYFDLRVIISYPDVLEMVSNLIWKVINGEGADHLCGVPYTALPIATILSYKEHMSMLIRRKEEKSYGTKKMIEGVYKEGQTCIIIEDVIVSGTSVLETANLLRKEKLEIKLAAVFLDREQGGQKNLEEANIRCTSVLTIRQMLKILQKFKRVDEVALKNVMNYLESNPNAPLPSQSILPELKIQKLSCAERASKANTPLAKRLLTLIDAKKSNLCVAVDVETSEELLSLADKLGPYICLLKTHVDILKDFSLNTAEALQALSSKHDFLIFEDRKFADIGHTVELQYTGGLHRIFDWAHLVTVHAIPGPGVIEGLLSTNEDRGCVLVAQMSSDQNLISANYVKDCAKMAEGYREFVIGFVCQSLVHEDPNFISFTPGVSLSSSADTLGQRYISPEEAIAKRGADVVIVGRGITACANPVEKVKEYQRRSYDALVKRSLQINA